MKKSYLKEFQVDIGWVILIFSFKLEVFWRYGSKTKNFSLKLSKRDSISVEKLVYLLKTWYFGMKTSVGNLFHRKTSDFIKIYNISWRWLKRDCITVEKLIFFMIFVENLIFQWNTLNGTAFKWKKLVFFSNFSKISKFPVISSFSLEKQWTVQHLPQKVGIFTKIDKFSW